MTHHKDESDPPFEVSKKSKFTLSLATEIALVSIFCAAAVWFANTNSSAASVESRLGKVEDTQAKIVEDVTVTRTKVEMILQHLERQDSRK